MNMNLPFAASVELRGPARPRRRALPGVAFGTGRALLAAAWLIGLSPLTQSATGLSAGRAVGVPGGLATLRVDLTAESPVVAAQFDLLFSPGLAEGAATDPGDGASSHHLVSADIAPGVRRVVVYSLDNRPLVNGALAQIALRLFPGLSDQVVPLTLTNVVLSDPMAAGLTPISLAHGTLLVTTALPARFTLAERLENGGFRLQFSGTPDRRYVLERSSTLTSWSVLSTNTAVGGIVEFLDPASIHGQSFYRAVVE